MLSDLESYAKEFNVPIMLPDGISYLTNYIKENNIINILEIGSAIGYSAIKMCMAKDDVKVTTIERNETMYKKALENIHKFKMDDRINIIYADALNIDIKGNFDMIFIDAAKSQYIKFFNKYTPLLNHGGVVITDNLNFHGLRENISSIKSKNLRSMMKKLNDYIEFLKNNDEFDTIFLDIGDGISISRKK